MAREKMNINERFKYLRIMQDRYRMADRKLKAKLLTEMEFVTGLQRKYLIGQMGNPDLYRHARQRERGCVYDSDGVQAIATIANALDWICAERLQPTLRETAEILVGFGELTVSAEVLDTNSTGSASPPRAP